MRSKVFESQRESTLPQHVELNLWDTMQTNLAPKVKFVAVGIRVGDLVLMCRQVEANVTALTALHFDTVDPSCGAVFNIVSE